MHNHGKDYWDVVKWILHYVKDSLDKCLVFDKSKYATLDAVGYVDSDYGSDLNRRHSISGYIFTFVWVLSLGKHPYSILQLYLLLMSSM